MQYEFISVDVVCSLDPQVSPTKEDKAANPKHTSLGVRLLNTMGLTRLTVDMDKIVLKVKS